MNEPATIHPAPSATLARFAKFVVLMLFVLIMLGGHTTTSGAGMAFPDWPLSHGSVNPDGWWANFMQRLEHGHRLTAETVGLLIGVLCAWVWRSKWSIPAAIGVSVALAFAAFLGVLTQAILGGLRVTLESGGNPSAATAFRVIHDCFAHIELSLVVALAAMLSPVWPRITASVAARSIAVPGWITAGVIFLQLIAGATMRHLGAGLAIQTWPQASPSGGWLPPVHNASVDLNFTHTRVGAVLVTPLVLALALRAIGNAEGEVRLIRPAALLVALLAAQVALGIFVIWKMRPPILTTLHVVNGAALLAATVLLAMRASRGQDSPDESSPSVTGGSIVEVTA